MTKKRKHSILFTQPTRTRQCDRAKCDVNNIMAKYEQTGLIDHVHSQPAQYGDFSNVGTYQEALNKIMLAQNQFDALPADLRKQFDNNPAEFVDFVMNPENQQQCQKMGLLSEAASNALTNDFSEETDPPAAGSPEKAVKSAENASDA